MLREGVFPLTAGLDTISEMHLPTLCHVNPDDRTVRTYRRMIGAETLANLQSMGGSVGPHRLGGSLRRFGTPETIN